MSLKSQPTLEGRIAEIAPGYFALSQLIDPQEHATSWIPRGTTGVDPATIYLVRGRDEALLMDTGYAALGDGYVKQLTETLGTAALRVLISRPEPDAMGNLEPIAEACRIVEFSNNSPLPPLYYVGTMGDRYRHIAHNGKVRPGTWLSLDGAERFLIIDPPLRTLSTSWNYDTKTQVLFSSDFFGHTQVTKTWAPLGPPSADSIATWMTTKFDWIPRANTRTLITRLRDLQAARPIAAIAPGHGLWIVGPERVKEAFDLTVNALTLIGARPAAFL